MFSERGIYVIGFSYPVVPKGGFRRIYLHCELVEIDLCLYVYWPSLFQKQKTYYELQLLFNCYENTNFYVDRISS